LTNTRECAQGRKHVALPMSIGLLESPTESPFLALPRSRSPAHALRLPSLSLTGRRSDQPDGLSMYAPRSPSMRYATSERAGACTHIRQLPAARGAVGLRLEPQQDRREKPFRGFRMLPLNAYHATRVQSRPAGELGLDWHEHARMQYTHPPHARTQYTHHPLRARRRVHTRTPGHTAAVSIGAPCPP
jgi:hypothetical protein